MAAKKPSPDTPSAKSDSTQESPVQEIKQEKNPLVESIVARIRRQYPEQSEDEIRQTTRDTLMCITQMAMEGKEVIIGDMLFRRKPDKDSPEAKAPRPGYEHLLHVDIEYTPPEIPGLSKDSFPMSLPPDLLTKH